MSASCGGLDAGAVERMPNDRSNSTLAQKAPGGSFAAQKHATASAARASIAQVSGDRCANVLRKGKAGSLIALASDTKLSRIPVNILKLQKSYLACPQPQSC